MNSDGLSATNAVLPWNQVDCQGYNHGNFKMRQKDLELATQVIAAAITAGNELSEALEYGDAFLRWLSARASDSEPISQPSESTTNELILNFVRNVDSSGTNGKITYKGKSIAFAGEKVEMLALMAKGTPVSIAQFKEKVWKNQSTDDGVVYNSLRDIRRVLTRIGLPEALQSRRGQGFWLESLLVRLVEE